MKIALFIGTDKAGFISRSNGAGDAWEIDGPMFKG